MEDNIIISQGDLVNIMLAKMDDKNAIVQKKDYTVNKQDPTAVTILYSKFFMEYGFTSVESHCPESEIVSINMVSSWGVEFTIRTSNGKYTAYFDGEWYRKNTGFNQVFRRILIEGIPYKNAPCQLEEDQEETE
ncbi:MAG: hypothetical protein KKD77_20150 [Gammaproteobacteria bacterium]|nr:hypothetical protein [Gammaproteobacteria bacterium]